MLSEEEKREIEAELTHYEQKRAACIEGLKILQRHRGGWVSDDGIADLAEILEMSQDEVDNVATFYNLIFRKPVGRKIILLCDSVSCWVMGYRGIYDHLQSRLGVSFGETTDDGEFTLLPMACLGDCDHAPVMMIGEELFNNLTPDKVDQALQQTGGRSSTQQVERRSNGETAH
jgi:NADH-quinone oxidoreductase subunit E